MTITEYFKLAARTRPDFIPAMQYEHCKTGVRTEVGELLGAYKKYLFYDQPLNVDNVIEELGDIMWYLSYFIEEAPVNHESEFWTCCSKAVEFLANNSYTLGEQLDDIYYCSADMDWDLLEELVILFEMSVKPTLGTDCDFTIVLERNIEKLKKRYPEGYTNDHAQMRLDKLEENE
jgi:NTP pyrophosphatase (non-canonical NTP hydrolase)